MGESATILFARIPSPFILYPDWRIKHKQTHCNTSYPHFSYFDESVLHSFISILAIAHLQTILYCRILRHLSMNRMNWRCTVILIFCSHSILITAHFSMWQQKQQKNATNETKEKQQPIENSLSLSIRCWSGEFEWRIIVNRTIWYSLSICLFVVCSFPNPWIHFSLGRCLHFNWFYCDPIDLAMLRRAFFFCCCFSGFYIHNQQLNGTFIQHCIFAHKFSPLFFFALIVSLTESLSINFVRNKKMLKRNKRAQLFLEGGATCFVLFSERCSMKPFDKLVSWFMGFMKYNKKKKNRRRKIRINDSQRQKSAR